MTCRFLIALHQKGCGDSIVCAPAAADCAKCQAVQYVQQYTSRTTHAINPLIIGKVKCSQDLEAFGRRISIRISLPGSLDKFYSKRKGSVYRKYAISLERNVYLHFYVKLFYFIYVDIFSFSFFFKESEIFLEFELIRKTMLIFYLNLK